jgi:hypothetical protein
LLTIDKRTKKPEGKKFAQNNKCSDDRRLCAMGGVFVNASLTKFVDDQAVSNAGFPSNASLKLFAGSERVSFAVIAGTLFFWTCRLNHLSQESSTMGRVLFVTKI